MTPTDPYCTLVFLLSTAGAILSIPPLNPHDILLIKGPRVVQEYLLNEVQEVYRLQGVRISDKHIGVIEE